MYHCCCFFIFFRFAQRHYWRRKRLIWIFFLHRHASFSPYFWICREKEKTDRKNERVVGMKFSFIYFFYSYLTNRKKVFERFFRLCRSLSDGGKKIKLNYEEIIQTEKIVRIQWKWPFFSVSFNCIYDAFYILACKFGVAFVRVTEKEKKRITTWILASRITLFM